MIFGLNLHYFLFWISTTLFVTDPCCMNIFRQLLRLERCYSFMIQTSDFLRGDLEHDRLMVLSPIVSTWMEAIITVRWKMLNLILPLLLYWNNLIITCFCLLQVEGIQGIMMAYTSALLNVSLAGPTLFGPVINNAALIASQSVANGGRKYFVLLIITVRIRICTFSVCCLFICESMLVIIDVEWLFHLDWVISMAWTFLCFLLIRKKEHGKVILFCPLFHRTRNHPFPREVGLVIPCSI